MFTEYHAGKVRNRIMVHGRPGDLVTQWGGSAYPTVDYYPDGNGSSAYAADSGQNLIEQYTYDAYGKPTFLDPAGNTITTSVCATDFLYTGQQWNSLSNLYDNRNRFYSFEMGRFLQPDPIGFAGDPSNLYRYCGNNPVSRSDPMGLDPSDVNTNPNHYADGGAATAEPITVTGTAVGNYGTVYPSVIAQGLPSVLGGPPVSNAGVSALDDPTIPTAEPVIVNDTPIKPSQPKRKGPSPVTVGDYFDLGRLRLQLYNYGLANAEQIKSEIRFIEMVNNGAGAYSAGTLAAIVGGEALAGTSAASGPPQNITPILRLIFQIMAGWEQGPPPIEPLPPPPGPVAEGPVIPGG